MALKPPRNPLKQSKWIAATMGALPTRPLNVDDAPLFQINARSAQFGYVGAADGVGAQFGHNWFVTRYRACK